MRIRLIIALFGVVLMTGFAVAEVKPNLFKPNVLIRGEVVAFHGTTPRPLLNPVDEIKAVYGYIDGGQRVDFVEGVDYVKVGTGIARVSGSAIYDFDNYSINMNPDGVTFHWVDTPRNPPYVFYYHVYVDYITHRAPVTIPALAAAAPTSIFAAGDSITASANTISRQNYGNDSDGYVGLLRKFFREKASVTNFSLSGSSITYLKAALPTILLTPPDVIIIAFGMNDHSNGMSMLDSFKSDLTSVINDIQAAGSRAILVGFFRENAAWENHNLTEILAYNQGIHDVAAATGSPFVDIDAAWEAAKATKTDTELMGDNFHHPSNFGQRIWFSKILPYLLTTPVSSADVPDYVIIP
jgi:lysophospholipase L1-like esterase